MARVTVEDCLRNTPNRFSLVILAAERARQLLKGAQPLLQCRNKAAVTALREVAAGKVRYVDDVEEIVGRFLDAERKRLAHNPDVAPTRRAIEWMTR